MVSDLVVEDVNDCDIVVENVVVGDFVVEDAIDCDVIACDVVVCDVVVISFKPRGLTKIAFPMG